MSHTRGPWRWMTSALVGDHGHRPVVLSACPGAVSAAEFRQRDTAGRLVPLNPESQDALLIAAAPELADALRWLVAAVTPADRSEAEPPGARMALEAARAALRKAGV